VRAGVAVRRALLLLLLVGLLGVVALFAGLPRLAASDLVRARIEAAGRRATGREVGYARLRFAWLPPRLRVEEARIAGARPSDPPFLEAATADLELSLAPLFARTLVVDKLVVKGATLRLARSARGLDLPRPEREPRDAAGKGGGEDAGGAGGGGGAGLALAVREVVLRGSQVDFTDGTVKPPAAFEVEDLSARARGEALDAPIVFEAQGRVGGGRIEAAGSARLAGDADAEIELDAVSVSLLAAYVEDLERAAGAVSGTLRTVREGEAAPRLDADLQVEDAKLGFDGFGLEGRLRLRAKLAGSLAAPSGSFELDATQAALDYAGGFRKPVGTEATLSGRLVPLPGGRIGADDVKLHVKNLDVRGRLSRRPRGVEGRFEFARFDLAGWEALLPRIEEPLAGGLGPGAFDLATRPLRLTGESAFDAVELRTRRGAPVVLAGRLAATGDALVSRDLVARVAGEPVTLALRVESFASRPRAHVDLRTRAADANALLSAFTSLEDRLHGPLDLDANLAAPLPEGALAEVLEGRATFRVGPGRLRGVSFLTRALEGLRATRAVDLGERVARAGGAAAAKDAFDAMTGSVDLSGGVARTEDLRIVYPDYRVELRGTVGLVDRHLDLTGRLALAPGLAAALRGEAAPAPGAGEEAVLPLARVDGTVEDPRVIVAPEALLALAPGALAERRTKLEEEIDERLGKGTGRELLDRLGKILEQEGAEAPPEEQAPQ
jgi:hypothetical protein